MDIAWLFIVLLVVILLVVVWFPLRWVRMRRHGGVNVALRWRPDNARQGWHLGVGRYHGEKFAWYRVWSLRSGPDRVFARQALQISSRRAPAGSEAYAVPAGSTVLRFESTRQPPIELAMGPDALTGFLSWLESSPPGRVPR